MTTIPAEWRPHRAIWTAWPSAADLWGEDLEPARAEVAAMIRALADGGKGDAMRVLAHGREAEATAKLALGQSAEVIPGAFGDIWFRDIGPIFDAAGVAHGFKFNGWGGKYQLPHDDEVGARLALLAKADYRRHDFILEGGAIEMDGEGTLLTTRQCLLNPNRNAHWTEAGAEVALKRALGVEKILWLDEGLLNDHTDGHIDNLARFVAPGRTRSASEGNPQSGANRHLTPPTGSAATFPRFPPRLRLHGSPGTYRPCASSSAPPRWRIRATVTAPIRQRRNCSENALVFII
jgi:agmatine deiminase